MDPDEVNAHLDRVLVGGRERRTVVIADADPSWPERFERERLKIEEALGELTIRVEHIGSTAVPGLAAKPVIDVLVTLADVENDSGYQSQLERAGYTLRVHEPG